MYNLTWYAIICHVWWCIHTMTYHPLSFHHDMIYYALHLTYDMLLAFMLWSCIYIPCYLFQDISYVYVMPCFIFLLFYIYFLSYLCYSLLYYISYFCNVHMFPFAMLFTMLYHIYALLFTVLHCHVYMYIYITSMTLR